MHEQIHAENKPSTAAPQTASGENTIERIAEPMRRRALENPTLSIEENKAAVMTGKFSNLLKIGNTAFMHLILTVSPAERETDEPFWHCSMSFISASTGRPKTVELWTAREMKNVKRLLPLFLGDVGLTHTQDFARTKTAVHCYRNLTVSELKQINWRSK